MTIAPPLPEDVTYARADAPGPSLSGVLTRFWWLIVLLAVVGAGVGYGVASQRDPVYTAEGRLTIADVNFATRSVPGFTEALETLSSSYSEAVRNDAVVRPIARRLDLDPVDVAARLSASPVPQSSVFAIEAEGPDRQAAIDLANAAIIETRAYIRSLDSTGTEQEDVLREFRSASRDAARIQERLDGLSGRRAAGETVASGRIVELREDLASAQLQTEVARTRYLTLLSGSPQTSARTISVLSPPRTATSDAGSVRQRMVLIGGVAGAAAGFLLAVLLARRRPRRGARL